MSEATGHMFHHLNMQYCIQLYNKIDKLIQKQISYVFDIVIQTNWSYHKNNYLVQSKSYLNIEI